MNNIFSKPSIYLAIIWLAVKILSFNFYPDKDLFLLGAGLNLIFILLIVILTLKKTVTLDSTLMQFKTLLQPVVLYVVLIGLSIFIYYSQVDPGYIEFKIQQSRDAIPAAIEAAGGFESYKEAYPNVKERTLAEYLEAQKTSTPSMLSAQGQALFSTFGLLLAGTFYALLFLIISKLALKRN